MTALASAVRGAAPLRVTSRQARNVALSGVRGLFGARNPSAAPAAHVAASKAPAAGYRAARLSTRAAAAATATDTAADGDYVEVHYTGTLDDGEVFDSSREREPLTFRIGAGKVIKGFDKAVTGLAVRGTRKQRLEPADAYGERREEMTAKVPLQYAPEGLKPGMVVRLQNGMQATVTAVTEEHVEIDANPPLAGKPLTFDVELMKLVKKGSMQRALFGAGCFWGVELAFQRIPGVLETRVGYAQGAVEDPTYEAVCGGETGHAEVVEVVYDPSEASFETLLDTFFDKHDPTQLNRQGNDVGTQYRSGVYVSTPEQQAAAEAAKAKLNAKLGAAVVTEIEPIKNFYAAEEYHQQYLEKGGRFGQPQSARKGCNDPIRCYG